MTRRGTNISLASVDHVKEKSCILFVEFAVPYFIDDQTGRPHKAIQAGRFFAIPSGIGKPVTKLRHLDKVCFQSVLAALIPVCLGKMSLSGPWRTYESQILVGMYGI